MRHDYEVGALREEREASEGNLLVCSGENEDEKLNEVMYEAWRFNRDCKLLRDGLQGLSWDGRYHFIWSLWAIIFCSHLFILLK